MDDDILLREDEGAVATLTLNNPGKLNALSETMLQALEAELGLLAGESEIIRVVILRGAGRAFCAGHDLKEMTQARQAEDGGLARFRGLFERCSRVMLGLVRLPQPVIAEVHGIATAAGCQLVASCDLAVAAEGTRFGVNGVNIGLFCSTPMVALTRVVPRKRAFEMLTTGEFIDAEEARAVGLVNRVVPEAALGAATRELAATIAGKPTYKYRGCLSRAGIFRWASRLSHPVRPAPARSPVETVEPVEGPVEGRSFDKLRTNGDPVAGALAIGPGCVYGAKWKTGQFPSRWPNRHSFRGRT